MSFLNQNAAVFCLNLYPFRRTLSNYPLEAPSEPTAPARSCSFFSGQAREQVSFVIARGGGVGPKPARSMPVQPLSAGVSVNSRTSHLDTLTAPCSTITIPTFNGFTPSDLRPAGVYIFFAPIPLIDKPDLTTFGDLKVWVSTTQSTNSVFALSVHAQHSFCSSTCSIRFVPWPHSFGLTSLRSQNWAIFSCHLITIVGIKATGAAAAPTRFQRWPSQSSPLFRFSGGVDQFEQS